MGEYTKLFIFVFVSWVIITIVSCCINWTITRNAYSFISFAMTGMMFGMATGRTLTLKEVE